MQKSPPTEVQFLLETKLQALSPYYLAGNPSAARTTRDGRLITEKTRLLSSFPLRGCYRLYKKLCLEQPERTLYINYENQLFRFPNIWVH